MPNSTRETVEDFDAVKCSPLFKIDNGPKVVGASE